MTNAQRIRLRLSQVRQRLNEISGLEGDAFTAEIRSEAESLQTEFADLETRHQAAIVAEGEPETRPAAPDAEMRERVELRSKASVGRYLLAAMRGRQVTGAEAELLDAAGIGDGIPLELWDVPGQTTETRADSATAAPGTVGVNLDRIRPAVFANSIAPRLGIEMPRVESGTYASGDDHHVTDCWLEGQGWCRRVDSRGLHGIERDAEADQRPARNPDRGRGRSRAGELRVHPAGEPIAGALG